jgi:hypothetical protein
MGRKGKTVVLASLFIVALLAVYRNLGVPIIKLWPLILFDTLLRVPGDNILNLLDPAVPRAVFEILRGLLQTATVILLWWGFGKFRSSFRGPLKESSTPPQDESSQARIKRIRKKRFVLTGWIVIGFLIVNGRCGRGAVYGLSLFCGTCGYPTQVTTVVSVQGPESEKLPSGDPRPPMMFFFEDADQLSRHDHLTRDIWRLTGRSGATMMIIGGPSSLKDLEGWRGDLKEASRNADVRASLGRGSYKGGNGISAIGANLDLFLAQAGRGWWREQAGGFIVAAGAAMPEGMRIEGHRFRYPPSIFHSDGLDNACRFLYDLTGVDIVNMAGEVRPSAWVEPESFAQREEGRGAIHIRMESECTLREMLEKIALSLRCSVDDQGGRFVFRELKGTDVELRIKQLFEIRRSSHSGVYPDPTLRTFPDGSSPYVAEYLDDADDEIINYALSVLEVVGFETARDDLLNMLKKGETKSGKKLSEGSRESLADLLMKAGEVDAFLYLDKARLLDQEHVSFWFEDRVNVLPSWGAVKIQDRLLARFRSRIPRVHPGRIFIRCLPSGITSEEAATVERLALDSIDAFSNLYWDEEASATLKFSSDGLEAKYHVDVSHDWGPLAAGSTPHFVDLRKVGDRWVVTRVWSEFGWIS